MAGFLQYNTGYDVYNLGNLASGTVVQASIDYIGSGDVEPYSWMTDSSGALIGSRDMSVTNGVLNLDGSSDYLRTTTTNFNSRAGTVEGWVYPREEYEWGFWQTHDSTSQNWSDWLAMFS